MSQKYLKVRPDDFLNPARSCEVHQVIGFKALFFSVELERFDGRFEADLVPILETVGDCFFRAIDAHWNIVYFMCLDPKGEGLS